jgi:phage gp16-like protein
MKMILKSQMKKCANLIGNMALWMDKDIPIEKVIEENEDIILILTLQNKLIKGELTQEEYIKECQMIGIKGAKRNLKNMIESNAPKEVIEMIQNMIKQAEMQVMEE